MIKQTARYQGMAQVAQAIKHLQEQVASLPDHQEYPAGVWEVVEEQIQEIEALLNQLEATDELEECRYSEEEWQMWKLLVRQTQEGHTQAMRCLMNKKDVFYQEVQSVGRSVKANRAYNDMKRIRF